MLLIHMEMVRLAPGYMKALNFILESMVQNHRNLPKKNYKNYPPKEGICKKTENITNVKTYGILSDIQYSSLLFNWKEYIYVLLKER
jgi:hypothetical protein